MISSDALIRLAAYADDLAEPKRWVKAIPLEGAGTSDDPYIWGTGVPALTAHADEFVKMAYDAGWVLAGFNWTEWSMGPEGMALRSDKAAIATASPEQLAKLLTCNIRVDRFVDGNLVEGFTNGLFLSIAQRAREIIQGRGAQPG